MYSLGGHDLSIHFPYMSVVNKNREHATTTSHVVRMHPPLGLTLARLQSTQVLAQDFGQAFGRQSLTTEVICLRSVTGTAPSGWRKQLNSGPPGIGSQGLQCCFAVCGSEPSACGPPDWCTVTVTRPLTFAAGEAFDSTTFQNTYLGIFPSGLLALECSHCDYCPHLNCGTVALAL